MLIDLVGKNRFFLFRHAGAFFDLLFVCNIHGTVCHVRTQYSRDTLLQLNLVSFSSGNGLHTGVTELYSERFSWTDECGNKRRMRGK